MRSLRGTVPFVVLLFIVGVAAANGCSPVKTPAPTPDIPATVQAAVATAMATQANQAEPAATPTSSSHTATPAVTTQVEPPALPPSVAALVVKSETVALITCRGHFVIIDAGVLKANADPDNRDEKERFTLLHLSNGKVAFRTSDGGFVTATWGEPWLLIVEETQHLREDQKFTLESPGDGEVVAITTVYDRYVTAMDKPDWNWGLRAETPSLSDWEKFEMVSLAE